MNHAGSELAQMPERMRIPPFESVGQHKDHCARTKNLVSCLVIMSWVLIAWIGHTDLRSAEGAGDPGAGPIAQALTDRAFEAVRLLSDHPVETTTRYVEWLKSQGARRIDVSQVSLSGPTHFGEIYERAVAATEQVRKEYGPDVSLTFHLSPGTPAMAAVWIILAKTRFPAELIESSREHGVRTASVPFDISADFIPDLLRRPDEALERLSASLPPEAPEFSSIVHRSQVMRRVITRARLVAPRAVPVLIEGESGTGKELLARAIHRASSRREGPFIAVNCGAIPEGLLESELFGHKKGSFTGAVADRRGLFQAATSGTLFLDEVGDMPLSLQVKLLRALEERKIRPVGSHESYDIDVRVISATHRKLEERITTGEFREDLYYRLNVVKLYIPALAERREDIPLLANHFLSRLAERYRRGRLALSPEAMQLLVSAPWPGNVRQLLT